jgi:hypothetical protein
MAANDIQNKTASIFIDDQPAIDAYNRLLPKAEALNKKIDEGTKKADLLQKGIQRSLDAGGKPEALQKKLAGVNKELDNSRKALEKVTTQQKALQDRINNGVGPSIKEQAALVRKLENEYLNLAHNTEAAKNKLVEFDKANDTLRNMRSRLDDIKKAQNESSGGFAKVFGNVAQYFTAYTIITKAAGALKAFFTDSVKEAREAETANARFKSTLDNLGRADAFDRLEVSADRLHDRFKNIDDDDVVAVFEKLIDYGKLTERQMNDLLPVIANFAAKQRISLSEASDVIVKSLEGNAKGLKTFGISLKDASTPAERLKVIMTELKEKVDGANDSFLQTSEGGLAAAEQEYKDLKEEIGTGLIPILNKLMNFVIGAIKGLPVLAAKIKNTFSDIGSFFSEGFNSVLASGNPLSLITGGIAGVISAKEEREIKEKFEAAGRNIKKQVDEFADKTSGEVYKKIDEINFALLGKQAVLDKLEAASKNTRTFSKEDQKNLIDYRLAVFQLKGTVEGLYKSLERPPNTVLGTGDPDFDPAEAKRKRDEAAKERQKKLDDQKKFLEELRKLNLEYGLLNQSEFDKETTAAIEKYNALKVLAHGNEVQLKQLEEDLGKALLQIQQKYSQKQLDEMQRRDEEALRKRQAMLDKQLKEGFDRVKNIGDEVQSKGKKDQIRQLDSVDLEILKANGKKKLDAERERLQLERDIALNEEGITQEKIAVIKEQFRQKDRDLQIQFYADLFNQLVAFGQQVSEIATLGTQAKTNKENAQLAVEKKNNDERKKSYDLQLKGKLISQQQYNAKIADLDEQNNAKAAALKKRQFQRQQKADIIAAEISTAQSILSALQTKPFLLGLVLAGVAAIKGREQIKEIKSRPVPEFAKGGIPAGPKHKDGGIDMINSKTGKKVGEMEGGEPYMILSGKTYKNNKPVVDALLYNSMHRDGSTIDPWFKNRTYRAIDFSGISRSIQNVRHYESGGVFNTSTPQPPNDSTAQPIVVPAMTEQQEALLQSILTVFSKPIKASVVYQEIKDADDTVNAIKSDATFGKK